jgi:hypothetical protein
MAKKKTTTTTKGKKERSATKPAGAAARKEATPATTTAATESAAPDRTATPARERVRDPRLPPPGTLIQKRARDGSVRCECTVYADGIRYKGTLFKSLSAAAMAAAKDLGIRGATQNGFTFWGLSKPPRAAADPVEALGRAWERYRERASAIVGAVKDDDRDRVHSALGEHLDALKELRGRVA